MFDSLDDGNGLHLGESSDQNCHSEMDPAYFRSHTGIISDKRVVRFESDA